MNRWFFIVISFCVLEGCKKNEEVPVAKETLASPEVKAKFSYMSPDITGVNFTNDLKEDYNYNFYNYPYIYNGGGVATGDVNGDSLPDLYFTATLAPDKLYLNLGNFKFLDVTDKSGVTAREGFKTGTVMADINGDGKLDIYVCRTSKSDDGKKTNHAFINMGNKIENGVSIPVFEEQSKKLGLDDNSNTDHACFFDYDRDGDLDLFLLSHKIAFSETANIRLKQSTDSSISRIITKPSPFETNKFYRNDNGHFTEVTAAAGLESTAFGLSVTTADLNSDGWPDLYVANDYIEPDRVYINNKNGTFTDHYFDYLKHSNQNAMGSDIADINNDGLDDIIVLDMKPEDPIRYKTLLNVMLYDRYNLMEQYGYGRQVGRNVLQLNNGNNTFSEIGQYAGISATDWSWGALIADLDNDGWKDVFIANGYRRDVTNFDYLNFTFDSLNQLGGIDSKKYPDINQILNLIPAVKIQNYLFINNKNLTFTDVSKPAGMDKISWSNGSAFADLDRDGDLDLIVNNMADPAFICRNDVASKHWLQIKIQEIKGNTDGIGSSVHLFAGGIHQHEMMMTNKGFFSSSEPII
ncbi:MAG: VCBS repeat-containing protein, partial [Saprospiraceae bacterium]